MQARTAIAVGVAVLVAAAGASFGAGAAIGSPVAAAPVDALTAAPAVRSPTPTSTPTVAPTRSVPSKTAAAEPLRTCSVDAATKDPRLADFEGAVLDAKTGQMLLDRHASRPSRTASVLKVVTSAAALSVLGPDHRFTTRVVRGSEPGQVVLVGGGDVTLSRTPVGTTTAYAGAPHLATLAAAVKKAWAADPKDAGVPIRQVVLDASYFGGPTWQSSWDAKERGLGSTPEITALMVDGDRAAPGAETSPRGTDPIDRAGDAFAALLGSGVTTKRGTAPGGAEELASVRSQPVSTLIEQALLVSDNTLAEALARETAIRSGHGNTFAALQASTVAGLQRYGIATTGIVIEDGSGLSADDRVPPTFLTRLFVQVLHREHGLGPIYDGLPVAGRTGTLAYSDRFTGAAARARGEVRAKTGWIDTGYTLAGLIHAQDGRDLTFAFMAIGSVTPAAKTALDALTADVWSCGDDLSDR